jgi:hypothetical protein
MPAPLPLQAFHALHEQGAASAPLWDSQEGTIIGIISASDFIHILTRLTHNISSGANPLSEVRPCSGAHQTGMAAALASQASCAAVT